MDKQQKQAALSQYFITKGIFSPDAQQAEIQKLAESYPAAKAQEEGLTDVIDIAYAAYLMMTGGNTGTPGNPAEGQNPAQFTKPAESYSAEDKKHINTQLAREQALRSQQSAGTFIKKLLLSRPAPKDYIPAGTKGVMKTESFQKIIDKVNAGTYQVMADDPDTVENPIASTTNYQALVAAMQNPEATPFEVHIGNLNTRPAGYIVAKVDNTGANATQSQMTRDELEVFLTMATAGYITAENEASPGAKLRYVDPKNSKKKVGEIIPGHAVIVDMNKQETIKAGNYDILTSPKAGETKKATVKSEICFKVIDTKADKKKDGTPVTRTLRASLEIAIPVFETKVEYIDKFDVSANTNFTETPNKKALEKIREAQVKAIADLTRVVGETSDPTILAYQNDLEKFCTPATPAPAVEV